MKKRTSFREELTKFMPGYKWTIKKNRFEPCSSVVAVGTQSSGFNRLSTLQVTRSEIDGKVSYEAKSAGLGKRAPWMHSSEGGTLAQALRALQDYYEGMARTYNTHAADLRSGRKQTITYTGEE